MKYNIVSTKQTYKGIERSISHVDLWTKKNKRNFDTLLDIYFEYISETLKVPSEKGLFNLIQIYREFKKYDIECEIIAYDLCPLTDVFGYPLEFLGIDAVCDMAESILSECDDKDVCEQLDCNGLCKQPEDVERIALSLEHGNLEWLPCYVYKILVS